MSSVDTPRAQAQGLRGYLILTGALAGAVVMVIEVLGSRVLGPYYGVSLFVWTSLIIVTLTALAAGYACGGAMADRRPAPDLVYALVLAAGVAMYPIPALKPLAFTLSQALGLRAGALASAALLFGPALFLLGCTTPCIVRVALREMNSAGRTIGLFYAASTVGSIAGTALAGFVLVPLVGVSLTVVGAAMLLTALAAGYFLVIKRQAAPCAAVLLAALALPTDEAATTFMPDGTQVEVVHSREGHYGQLTVVDFRYGALHTRELLIDGLVQGGVDVANGLSVYEYAYLLEALPVVTHGSPRTALVVGLGAGVVPRRLQAAGIDTEVVDIDPAVRDIARSYFAFPSGIPVHVADARAFLATTGSRYDLMVLDVFTGDTTPAHLLTLEAVELMKSRLAAGGVLAANLVGSADGAGDMTGSVVRTFQRAFGSVAVYPLFDPQRETHGNFVLVAHDGPAREHRGALRGEVHESVKTGVERALAGRHVLRLKRRGPILTDEHNALDFADLHLKETVRRTILETTPETVLRGMRTRGPAT